MDTRQLIHLSLSLVGQGEMGAALALLKRTAAENTDYMQCVNAFLVDADGRELPPVRKEAGMSGPLRDIQQQPSMVDASEHHTHVEQREEGDARVSYSAAEDDAFEGWDDVSDESHEHTATAAPAKDELEVEILTDTELHTRRDLKNYALAGWWEPEKVKRKWVEA